MQRLLSRWLPALPLALALIGSGCTTSTSTSTPPEARRSSNPAADLAAMLSGRFEGASPGNKLTLNIQSVGIRSLEHPYDLFLEVRGKYQDDNVHQEGYLHLHNQGRDVAVGYIPHFDPTVSALSPGAARFTSSEINAACSVYFKPVGDGFVADTAGSTTCAFALRGAVGKWEIRAEPGTIVVRNVESGETLRFKRVGR
jgi:hypothetical protein